MSIEKMLLVQLSGNMDRLDETLFRCLDAGDFQPEQLSTASDKLHGYTQISEENPYKTVLSGIKEIALSAGISLEDRKARYSKLENVDTDSFISDFRRNVSSFIEERDKQRALIEQNTQALLQLEHLKDLDVSLDDIFGCRYVEVRFGRLPSDSYPKLKYYDDRMFIFLTLSEENGYHWGVYFTTEEYRVEIDDIFSSLYFERIWIPDYVHGSPESAKKNIVSNLENAKEKLSEINACMDEYMKANLNTFYDIYDRTCFLNESFDLRKYAVSYKQTFHIAGFIPARNQIKFREHFDGIKGLQIDFKPPDSDNRLQVPTKIRNIKLFKPFEMFVDMYGTPSYNELDPTPFVGITYMLLFGIMFGDLGQGLVISLIGLFLWKVKKMNDFGGILVRIGLSSAVFGVVYGSVFGLEEVLNPLYKTVFGLQKKPIEIMNPTTINGLLITAIGIGIVLIIVSMLINIILGLKNRDYEKAVFSNNGLAGMVFYVSVLAGVLSMLTGGKSLFSLPYILFLIVLPILVIFLKHPLGKLVKGNMNIKPEDGISSFIIEGFFELFEVVLSFVTNTMSYLRVGGFIISHAGMMAVVLTLTNMFSGSGKIAVMVIGNIFVMCLEGFIVGIQVLRLEFYEMFSRYFDGQGKAFVSISDKNKD